MKKRSRQGLRRFRVEVQSWGNYVERIAELERTLAKKPRTLHIEIVGAGEIPADAALRFRAALMGRSPRTRIVTHARSSLQGGSVLEVANTARAGGYPPARALPEIPLAEQLRRRSAEPQRRVHCNSRSERLFSGN